VSDVDQAAFRQATGQFPGGIVVVTTSGGHAMTVSAFASVSLEPPLVLFCAEKIARFHDAVLEAGAWAVSILAEDGEKTARWLATRGRPLEGQLDEVPHHLGPVTGAPLLDGAVAALECQTFAVYDGGDHSIIVGRVTAVDGPADPPARGAAPGPPARGAAPGPPTRGPLIHHAGRYRRLSPAED
jgi:flavin reductase (DIM6/NTAB) family NADH-FMN oxidoreductase RutF